MLSSRGRRRLIVLMSVLAFLAVGAALFIYMRSQARGELIDEARRDGMAAYERGEYETALDRLSYYLSHEREDVEALLAFADTRARIPTVNGTHIPESISHYKTVLSLDPDSVEARDQLLLMFERSGRRIEWMELADRILADDPDHVDALRLRAIGRYVESRYAEAGEDLDRLIALQPERMRWRLLRLQVLRDQNVAQEEILALCDEWIASSGPDGRFRLLKAQALAATGAREDARQEALRAAEAGAADGETLQQMVALLDVLQLRDDAAALIDRTVARYPNATWPLEIAVRRLWQSNRLDQALTLMTQVSAEREGLDRPLLRWKGLLHVVRDEHEQALAALAALESQLPALDEVTRDEDRAWISALRARLTLGDGNWSEALRAYRTAVQLDPQDPVLNFLVGEAFMLAGETELAVHSLERACRTDPNWLAAQVAYAEALLATGRSREAAGMVRELLQRAERPPVPLYVLFARAWLDSSEPSDQLGILDASSGQPISLVDMLQRLHRLTPDDRALAVVLVRAASRYGREDIARQVIDSALAAEPPDAELLLELARVSAAHDLGEEAALLAQAQQASGLTVEVIDATARHYARQGRGEEGFRYLEESLRAIDRDQADEVARQLVRAEYLALIDHPETAGAFERLLDLPDRPVQVPARVLSTPAAWSSRLVIRKAIDQFAALVGERSPRVAMAEVNYLLTFRPGDPAARAQAQVLVNDVLQQTPDSLSALSLMSQLYLLGDEPDYDGAIDQLERALSFHPHEPELYIRLIRLLQRRGDFGAADDYLRRLNTLTADDPGLRQTELELLERQGDFSRIVNRLTEQGRAPTTEAERLYLITRLHRVGRHAEALQRMEALLREESPSELVVRTAARLYADSGRFEEGRALIESFHPPGGEAPRQLLVGEFLQESGRSAEARSRFERALEFDPGLVEAIVHLASVHLAEGRPGKAFSLAERGLRIDGANEALQTTLLTSGLLLDEAHRQRARDLLGELELASGPHVETLRVFERAQSSDQPSSDVLAESRRLTQRHSQFLPAWRLAVLLHVQAGQVDTGIRIATEASARLPARHEPAELAANLLAREGRLPEALQMARTWRQRSLDRSLPADAFIASVQLALDQPDAAARQLEPHAATIVAERDVAPQRATLLLRVLLAAGRAEGAMRHYQPLLAEGERWRTRWLESAASLPYDLGASALRMIEPQVRDQASSAMALASTWSTLGQRTGNVAAFERADALAKQAASMSDDVATPALLLRAQAADWRGDLMLAETLYREGLSADPDNLITLNNLSYVLIRRGEQCAEAAELIARAHELAPDVPEIMDTQAHAMLCLDRPEEAERMCRRALERRPDSPDFLFTLGLALGAQSQWSRAAETLKRIDEILEERGGNAALRAKVDRLRQSIQQERMLGAMLPEDTVSVAP